jgi:hypothetical protein
VPALAAKTSKPATSGPGIPHRSPRANRARWYPTPRPSHEFSCELNASRAGYPPGATPVIERARLRLPRRLAVAGRADRYSPRPLKSEARFAFASLLAHAGGPGPAPSSHQRGGLCPPSLDGGAEDSGADEARAGIMRPTFIPVGGRGPSSLGAGLDRGGGRSTGGGHRKGAGCSSPRRGSGGPGVDRGGGRLEGGGSPLEGGGRSDGGGLGTGAPSAGGAEQTRGRRVPGP